jgi:hypothetical protein
MTETAGISFFDIRIFVIRACFVFRFSGFVFFLLCGLRVLGGEIFNKPRADCSPKISPDKALELTNF